MSPEKLTYRDSGVDIQSDDDSVRAMVSTMSTEVGQGFGKPMDVPGHFTGLIDFGEHALSMCTDGVGSKLMIADAIRKWDTLGIDCMAMNVNDLICVGATPIAFVDYIAMEKPSPELNSEIGKGLAEGARQAGVHIIGGETSSLPEIVKGFDLAGTALGYVKKEDIITGQDIQVGDSIIGLPSSGLHSNGYSLVRKIIQRAGIDYHSSFEGERSWGLELLEPTIIYVKEVLAALQDFKVNGLANITGGGLRNLPRLKKGLQFVITDPMPVLSVFRKLQELGNIEDWEMHQVFNMGMGFAMVAPKDQAPGLAERLGGKVVGEAREGSGAFHEPLNLVYE